MFDFIFSLIAKIAALLMIVALIVFVVGFFRVMCSTKKSGSNPHNPNTGSGMPWG